MAEAGDHRRGLAAPAAEAFDPGPSGINASVIGGTNPALLATVGRVPI